MPPQSREQYSCFLNPTIHFTAQHYIGPCLHTVYSWSLCLPLHVSGQVVVERLGCYLAAARAVGGLPGLDRAPPSSSRWTRHGYSDVLWTFHRHYHHTTLSLLFVIAGFVTQCSMFHSAYGVPLQFACHRCAAFTSIHLVTGCVKFNLYIRQTMNVTYDDVVRTQLHKDVKISDI